MDGREVMVRDSVEVMFITSIHHQNISPPPPPPPPHPNLNLTKSRPESHFNIIWDTAQFEKISQQPPPLSPAVDLKGYLCVVGSSLRE